MAANSMASMREALWSNAIDMLGWVVLVAFISVMATAIGLSVRSHKERMRNLEESGLLVKTDDGRGYELCKVNALGHEYITFRNATSDAFGVAHSPDCPCQGRGESNE